MQTRRELLVASAAAVLLSRHVAAAASVPDQVVLTNGAAVRLFHPSDPEFPALLNQRFPGLATAKRFDQVKPFMTLAWNAGSLPVDAFSIRWTRYSASGVRQESYRRRFVRRPSRQLKTRTFTAEQPMLRPGEVALVTPTFYWTSSRYAALFLKPGSRRHPLGKYRLARYARHAPRARGLMARKGAREGVLARLEAVMSNGLVSAGKAGATLAVLVRNQRNAEHDVAVQILDAASRRGRLDVKLVADMSALTLTKRRQPPHRHRHYVNAGARFAQKALHLANAGDPRRLQQTLAKVGALPKLII